MLIIHLDDIGINAGSNQAAKELLKTGIPFSASVIVPASHAAEFFSWAALPENCGYDIGVHSAVTCEWEFNRWKPMGSDDRTRSFRTEAGYMISGKEEEIAGIDCREFEAEISAQVEHAASFGGRLTHLDNHMWTIRKSPQMLDCYLRVAARYNLVPHIPEWSLFTEDRIQLVKKWGCMRIKNELWVTGKETESYTGKKKKLIEMLRHLPEGLSVLTIHPNADTPQARHMLPCLKEREEEYHLFMDREILEILRSLKGELSTWEEIGRNWYHEMSGY